MKIVIFHSYVNVYQRVYFLMSQSYPHSWAHLHRRAVGVRKGGTEDVGRMLPWDVARVAWPWRKHGLKKGPNGGSPVVMGISRGHFMTWMIYDDLGYLYFSLVGGWPSTSLKNDGVKVSWDDEIPNIWKIIQMFHTTNQFRTPPIFDQHLAKVRICWSRLWIWLSRTKQWIFQPWWLPEAINIGVIFHPMIFLIISQYIFIISPDIVGYKPLYIYIYTSLYGGFPKMGGSPKASKLWKTILVLKRPWWLGDPPFFWETQLQ